nr:leucine-rich repeat-containing protein 15-like isoform X1 [Leptinotarsa decemlineata]
MTIPCPSRFLLLLSLLQMLSINPGISEIYLTSRKTTFPLNEKLDFLAPRGCSFGYYPEFRMTETMKTFRMEFCDVKELSKEMFQKVRKLEYLAIDHNGIESFEEEAFVHLLQMKHLNASDNSLNHFNAEWFILNKKLEVLEFSRNKFQRIPGKAFAGLSELQVVNFDYNEIDYIEPGSFTGINNLAHLGLRNNKLKSIRAEIFPNQVRIEYLLIGGNYLNFLPNQLMERVSHGRILMDINPWKCSCMENIYFWLFRTHAVMEQDTLCSREDVPVCASQRIFSSSCQESVDEGLTRRFIKALTKLSTPIEERCTRLLYFNQLEGWSFD